MAITVVTTITRGQVPEPGPVRPVGAVDTAPRLDRAGGELADGLLAGGHAGSPRRWPPHGTAQARPGSVTVNQSAGSAVRCSRVRPKN